MRTITLCRALIVGALLAATGHAQTPSTAGGAAAPAAARDVASRLPRYATRQNVFAIPFTVDRRVAQPVEVHLYASTDQGATWQLSSRQPPGAQQFTFRSRGDGEYWFASRTLDAGRQASSLGPLQPELRVVVDTVPPQIDFNVRTGPGGEVLASWQVADQNLMASSLKIEYQEEVAQPWKPVAVTPASDEAVRTSHQGQTSWRPETRSPTINVRAEVRDRAGNLAVVNRRLLLPLQPPPSQSPSADSLANMADPFARRGQTSEGAVAWPSDNAAPTAPLRNGGPLPPSQAPQVAAPLDPSGQPLNQFASTRAAPPETGSAPTSPLAPPAVPETVPSVSPPPPAAVAESAPATAPPAADTALPDTAAQGLPPSESPAAAGAPATGTSSTMLPPGERPHMTSATRFQLAYDVDAVGPSGVSEVQLWATADGGRTWRLWGTDDDLQSPFEVVVEEEGIFGFHVVIVGRNGLAGRKPRTGDLADIYIGVDTQSPVAKLTAAAYGNGNQAGRLLIRWEASDPYLDPRPVTLKFSEHPEGPWTVIASALPNTGEYAWPADAQAPAAVYVRLEVRDEAGNVAADQTTDAVRLDGLAPKARIRGVQPIQDADREAFRQPRRS